MKTVDISQFFLWRNVLETRRETDIVLVKSVFDCNKNKTPSNRWGRQNVTPLKFDPKPSKAAFSAVWRGGSLGKCRREIADDVIFSLPVDSVGTDVLEKFG